MKKTKFNIDWSLVGILVVIFLPVVALFLFTVWQLQMSEQEIQTRTLKLAVKQLVVKWAIQNVTRMERKSNEGN